MLETQTDASKTGQTTTDGGLSGEVDDAHEMSVSSERIAYERDLVFKHIIGGAIKEVSEKKKQGDPLTDEDQAISSFDTYYNLIDFDGKIDTRDVRHPLRVTSSTNGKQKTFTVTEISQIKNDTFTCYVLESSELHTFSRQQMIAAQLISEDTAIQAFFKDRPQAVAFIRMYQNADTPSDTINEIIKQTTRSLGLISSDTIISSIITYKEKNTDLPASTETDLNQILNALKGTNIVDKKALSSLSQILLQKQLSRLMTNFADRKAHGDEMGASNIQQQINMWSKLLEGEDPLINRYFEMYERGEIHPDTISSFTSLLTNGDVDKFLTDLKTKIENDPKLTPEQKEEKSRLLAPFMDSPGEGIMSIFSAIALELVLEIGKSVVAGQSMG